ncbi:ribosomal protein S18 acetylase RimI-like enzyme [Pseudomonas sp. SJZ080]|jgi:ribosomal protein S18 acetylase RimI-like enzyme|uniref:GNAT family N-acetyltransferase n=1 Tax=Pseudomonas sp. SJZ080 TaxID=2572888 RepID=UPI00119ADFA2|nr:GNAT family N-acetyltransferase [Pseudomonas sp. SJZ080]TWC47099.1 ribosomal protein S18 acetylase RimI-like enzyme [Pseudomonas sp. SJZ080]
MTSSDSVSADGLVVRPSRANDGPFLHSLYQSARPDLQWIDGERDVVEHVVAQQFQVQEQGLGEHFPNALHYVIEKLGTAIGALTTDFGPNEIRVLYLAFIPPARGQGYGRAVLQGVQKAAQQIRCPVATVVWANNAHARQHYLAQGFQVEERNPAAERLVWYPKI